MYLYVYKCGECRYFGAGCCPWKGTDANHIAGECFTHTSPVVSGAGTAPLPAGHSDTVYTAASSGAPIAVGTE